LSVTPTIRETAVPSVKSEKKGIDGIRDLEIMRHF
jgi:hypothetical protein